MKKSLLLLTLVTLVSGACKHDPEFYINGKGYYTELNCKVDSTWTTYEFRYGMSYRGKYEWSYGPKYNSKCLLEKLDTIACE